MRSAVETILLEHPAIWRGDGLSRPAYPSVPTGYFELDRVLPGGGWPVGALTEVFSTRPGIGELSLLMPALVRLSRDDPRWVMFVSPPHIPYAPALQAAGVRLDRFVVVRTRAVIETVWAIRQALAAGGAPRASQAGSERSRGRRAQTSRRGRSGPGAHRPRGRLDGPERLSVLRMSFGSGC